MLKGFINITQDPRLCFELSQQIPNTKIISLDEDDSYIELSPSNNRNVLMGTILLPPMEALWAEIDGDRDSYNISYYASLSSKPVCDFINTLIGYVFNGGNIIIFAPEFDPSGLDNTMHMSFLLNYLEQCYGLHLGTSRENTFHYDSKHIPMYLIGIYGLGIVTPQTFLTMYPLDAILPDEMVFKLISDLNIYGLDTASQMMEITSLRRALHHNNMSKLALHYV